MACADTTATMAVHNARHHGIAAATSPAEQSIVTGRCPALGSVAQAACSGLNPADGTITPAIAGTGIEAVSAAHVAFTPTQHQRFRGISH